MTVNRLFRILSGSGASWSVPGLEAGAATEGWQDKRAHIARRSGGCFCWGFRWSAHIATLPRNVRDRLSSLIFLPSSHLAEPRDGR